MCLLKIFAAFLCAAITLHADTIKIGVILPLSGNNAQVGQPMLKAIKLFEHEQKTNNYRHNYQLIVEDDQFVPRLTAEAISKLLNVDKVDAVVCYGIAPGNAVAPRTATAGIPMLCVNASYPKIANGKNNFLHWPPVEEETAKLSELVEHMGFKRIAILADRNPGIISVVEQIKTQLAARKIEIVAEYNTNPGERDFRTTLTMIREKKPEALLPFALSPELDIILSQRKQVGLDCPVVGFEVFNFLGDKNLANGFYYVSPSIGTSDFQQKFKEATGAESEYSLAQFYDSLNLLRQSYEAQEKPNAAAACAWLRNLKNTPSAVGKITMDPQGIIHSPIGIFQMREGQPVPVTLEEVKPGK